MPDDLMVGDRTTEGMYVITSINPVPHLIPNSSTNNGWLNYWPINSADDYWFGFYRAEGDEPLSYIWLSSLDGEIQWQIGPYSWDKSIWLESYKAAVLVGLPEQYLPGSSEHRMPMLKLNPSTGVTTPLVSLPENSKFETFFIQDQQYYSLYSFGTETLNNYFITYNYDTDVKTAVFRWLTGTTSVNHFNSSIQNRYDTNGNALFSVTVSRPYGFDIASNLSLETVGKPMKYEEAMKSVIMPGNYPNTAIFQIGQDLYVAQQFNMRSDAEGILFIYDNLHSELRDYCFDLPTSTFIPYVSPDGRFLAFSPNQGYRVTQEVDILDLETGMMARVPGYQIVGWGLTR